LPRRRSTDPTGLSRERILRVALDVAAQEGIDSLSMRRLAQELDVWPMSVYRYFEDKDALLDAMAAVTIGEIGTPADGLSWREQIHDLLAQAERSIAASPGIAARLPQAAGEPSALKLPEAGLAILTQAGLPPDDVASTWRTLWSYTFGFATFRVESARGMRAAVAALPEGEYPVLEETADDLATVLTDDGEFARGLDRILDGVEQRLAATAYAARRTAGTLQICLL
jgi:AcrR family transcriptional regulator